MTREELIEVMARANSPELWSDDPVIAHRAASPIKVSLAREGSLANAAITLAAIEAAGCMVVPVEPTEGMVKAGVGLAFRIRLSPEYSWKDYMTDLYRAMLAAAPIRGEG
ncbi:MAG: hypothetical protein ABFE07_22995 [Armatimonadia bacterium]